MGNQTQAGQRNDPKNAGNKPGEQQGADQREEKPEYHTNAGGSQKTDAKKSGSSMNDEDGCGCGSPARDMDREREDSSRNANRTSGSRVDTEDSDAGMEGEARSGNRPR